MSVLIKVCGMTRPEQAEAIDAMGADFLGFVFAAKSPRRVTASHVASIAAGKARRVGVFVEQDAETVKRIMDEAKLDLAQLHGGQDQAFCRAVGPSRVIKVFWPESRASRQALEQDMAGFGDLCAFMLLDAGASGGGHGKSLDFAALAGLNAPRPWLLAGGLTPENAALALGEAHAAGVDLNSGVEISPGVKDMVKVRHILHTLRRA